MTTKEKISALRQLTKRAEEAIKGLDVEVASLVLVTDELDRAISDVAAFLRQEDE